MSEAQITAEFLVSLEAYQKYTQEIEQMLGQTLQVLARFGNQAPFNLEGVLEQGRRQQTDLNKTIERMAGHIAEMEQLVRTSALITMSLELDRVLADVADTVIFLTGAERAFLLLLDDSHDDWRVMVARNSKGVNIDESGVTFSRGVIQSALETGEPILSTNAQKDDRFQDMQSVIRHDLRSVMVIPMLLQGNPLGVLYLDNRLTADVFHKKSLPVISAFASQAAIAIQNARLFEQVQANLHLAQREVQRLRIELDNQKLQSQVDEITTSDYFKELSALAKKHRSDDAT